MDIHTDTLDKHPESAIFLYGGRSCRQKAVPFSQNPAGYEKNVAGLAHLSPQTLGVAYSATSGATGFEKNAPENQRVKCRVRQVSPVVWIFSRQLPTRLPRTLDLGAATDGYAHEQVPTEMSGQAIFDIMERCHGKNRVRRKAVVQIFRCPIISLCLLLGKGRKNY